MAQVDLIQKILQEIDVSAEEIKGLLAGGAAKDIGSYHHYVGAFKTLHAIRTFIVEEANKHIEEN